MLEDFRAHSLIAGGDGPAGAQELLNWKALGVRGVDLSLEPGKPIQLAVRETTLSDFFARVIVHESGRINLQDLVRGDTPAAPEDGAAANQAAALAPASGERSSANNDRSTTDGDRSTTNGNRSTTDSDRSTTSSNRSTAGNDRSTANNDRSTAGNDRSSAPVVQASVPVAPARAPTAADPMTPLIFKVIVNLIGKALTAPFTLLASALGGGGEALSQVAFAPGSARLQPDALTGLDKVAKALTERPALKMTVVGTASLDAEREAYKRSRLQAMLQAEKRRAQVTAGQTPVASGDGQTESPIDPAESAELLAQLFARSEVAKPRDLAGKPKELTPADMEALLLANISADEQSMRELALRRGVAVKDYLASRNLPVERLFLGAARLADADAKWSPRAELNLGTN